MHEVPSKGWAQAEAQTQPCIDFLQTGRCPAGFACHAAHDAAQLRPCPCPTSKVRTLLQHLGWQLPRADQQASGKFGSALPSHAAAWPEACNAAAAICSALSSMQQGDLVQRAAAAAAQAAQAAQGEQLAPAPCGPLEQQGPEEQGRAVKREAEGACVGGKPPKLQRGSGEAGQSEAAAEQAGGSTGQAGADEQKKQAQGPHEDMTDSAHEASPPAASPAQPKGDSNRPPEQPPAGASQQQGQQAAGAVQPPAAGLRVAQLEAEAAALRAQVVALEHDLQAKDTACVELQDRWAVWVLHRYRLCCCA